jgi:hypothetical protein
MGPGRARSTKTWQGRWTRVAGLAALAIAFLLLIAGLALVTGGLVSETAGPSPTLQSSP